MGSGDLGWLAAVGMTFGIVCGFVLRLPAFLIVGFVCLPALWVSGATPGEPVLATVTTVVVLQIGFGLGVIGRAVLRARLTGRRGADPTHHR
jgi:hypothetical protein